jgi:hypothetical protein
MDTIIAAPASCEVGAVVCFLHAEGRSVGEIHEFVAPGDHNNVKMFIVKR